MGHCSNGRDSWKLKGSYESERRPLAGVRTGSGVWMVLHHLQLDGRGRLQIVGAEGSQGEQRSMFPKTLRLAMLCEKSSLAVEEGEYHAISIQTDPLKRVSRHIVSRSRCVKSGLLHSLHEPCCGLLHSLTGIFCIPSYYGLGCFERSLL